MNLGGRLETTSSTIISVFKKENAVLRLFLAGLGSNRFIPEIIILNKEFTYYKWLIQVHFDLNIKLFSYSINDT